VQSTSTSATGVRGISSSSNGVYAQSTSNAALYALSTNSIGAYITSNNNNPLVCTNASATVFSVDNSGNTNAAGGFSASYISTSSSTSTTPTLSFNASNTSVAKGATVSGSYVQDVIQNKSATAGASANYVVSPDNGTDSTYYGEFGVNSSVFSASTPADFFSLNNQIYFSGHDGDVAVGSGNGYKTYFPWGATAASAHVINASGALGFSTNLGTTLANSGTIGFGTSGQALITAGSGAAPAWGNVASPYSAAPLFGTGADGAVTISSGTTTLNRDYQYTNLTINGSGSINTNGWRVYVSGTLDISAAGAGAIVNNGNTSYAASGATGGLNPGVNAGASVPGNGTGGVLGGGGTGATGGVTTGTLGTANGAVRYAVGGTAGAGGNGGNNGAATNGGTALTTSGWGSILHSVLFSTPTTLFQYYSYNAGDSGAVPTFPGQNGTGGAYGGGDGTNAGGGGGGGGGGGSTVAIYARFIQRGTNSTAGIIQAKGTIGGAGGNGVAGTAGAGGGGGGGGGGFVYIVAEQLLGTAITNAIDVSGGAGGSGGNGVSTGKGGNGGTGGNGGNYQIVALNPASFTAGSFNAAGTAGGTTSTSTGAAGGAGATVRGNL
jgi:hypothetical protein